MRTPYCSCLSQTLAKKIHLNLVSNIKRTCGVLGLSFKALNWYSRFNVMYWMCIQLCYRGQSCICCVYSENELAIRTCIPITKKYIDWHENPGLRCYLTLNSLTINLNPVSVAYVIPSKYFQMKASHFFSSLLLPSSPGSTIVRAPPQLELDVGPSPEAWHLASDLQHPRTPRWCGPVLPGAQQRWHRPTRYQHLQSLCGVWLPHRGLCLSPQLHISFCQFSVFISAKWSTEGHKGFSPPLPIRWWIGKTFSEQDF